MPNWTANYLEITGKPEDVDRFIDDVTVMEAEPNDVSISYDLTKVNPIPDVFKSMKSGARTIDGVKYSQWFEDSEGVRPLLDINALEITDKYGTYDPVDWQYRNWGTKWGDCDTEIVSKNTTNDGIKEIEMRFDSAWSEPWMLLNDISRKYNLNITNHWDIELGNGDGVTKYPWTDEETQETYSDFVLQHEEMKLQVKKMFMDKNSTA